MSGRVVAPRNLGRRELTTEHVGGEGSWNDEPWQTNRQRRGNERFDEWRLMVLNYKTVDKI